MLSDHIKPDETIISNFWKSCQFYARQIAGRLNFKKKYLPLDCVFSRQGRNTVLRLYVFQNSLISQWNSRTKEIPLANIP